MAKVTTGGREPAAVSAAIRDAAMRSEPDRYLAATLSPHAVRADLAALAAFGADVARIPAVVSEAALGDIRLQWWRDALRDGLAGTPSGHPVADALVGAVQRNGLQGDAIEAMLEARELDLSGGMPQDDAGLSAYLQGTEGSLFKLALTVLGAPGDEADALANLAGTSYGLARGLCRLPLQLHNGGVLIPADRLRARGIDPGNLSAVPPPVHVLEAVQAVRSDLQAKSLAALTELRARWSSIEPRLRPALLPLAMVEPYFRAQSGRQVLVEPVEVAPLRRVVRIGLAHLTGRL